MNSIKIIIFILFAIAFSGCQMQIPVAVIGQDGKVLTGSNTVSLSEGSFIVYYKKTKCTGTYNPYTNSHTITIPVLCSNGLKGFARAFRDTPTSGSGTFRLNNGYTGDFVFGTAARHF